MRFWLALIVAVITASLAVAQPAGLVADRIYVDASGRLVAEGNVLVAQQQRSLSAARIIFDPDAEQLVLDGPLLITEPDGRVVAANAARLDRDLQAGIIEGARVILQDHVQIAASRVTRVDGTLSAADQVVATSCRVCASERTALWQIRARRVILDEAGERLWFDNARLEVAGLPVFWWPVLSLPEPGVDRATGFLFPSLRANTVTGTGIRQPFFITLGDHADLTLTPMLTTRSRTLEARYRQAFVGGTLEINAAATNDDTDAAANRAYIFIDGQHELPDGFVLRYHFKDASDRSYLSDYGFADHDRLRSTVQVERAARREALTVEGNYFFSQRADEVQEEIPSLFGDLTYLRFAPLGGGMGRFRFDGHWHQRGATEDAIGRDIARASLQLGWRGETGFGPGFRIATDVALDFSYTHVYGDRAYEEAVAQAFPSLATKLSWPLMRQGPEGSQLLEPFTQIGWTGGERARLPNEESLRAALDEGNLLSFSRFPAPDRRERGLTAASGVRWQWRTTEGATVSAIAAQLWREQSDSAFTDSSGLAGGLETYLIALGASNAAGLNATGRAVWDSDVALAKAEARLAWQHDRGRISSAYVQLREDDSEGRNIRIEELTLEMDQQLTRFWSGRLEARYDLAAEQPTRLGGELIYLNECVELGFAASRRYSISELVDGATDFGLTVNLLGFGLPGQRGATRVCDG